MSFKEINTYILCPCCIKTVSICDLELEMNPIAFITGTVKNPMECKLDVSSYGSRRPIRIELIRCPECGEVIWDAFTDYDSMAEMCNEAAIVYIVIDKNTGEEYIPQDELYNKLVKMLDHLTPDTIKLCM